MDRPQWSAVESMIQDLNRSLGSLAETQRRMLEVVGTASSPDRLIRATVGPRGQLIGLEIDPRIYRTPDATKLSASILATVRAAVEDANAQTKAIIDQAMPRNLGPTGPTDLERIATSHDADLPRMFRQEKP